MHQLQQPIYLVLLIGIMVGLLFFKDYGPSWDEPEFYYYGDLMSKAYSIGDRIDGIYNLESLLDFQDLRFYGPAYLLIGKLFHSLTSWLFPNTSYIELWHLVNFLFFLLGVFFFYKLTCMFVSPRASLASTLLFCLQPVLFGSAWINPKDIPLLVFFLGSIYIGIRSIQSISLIPESFMGVNNNHQKTTVHPSRKKKIFILGGLLIAAVVITFAFSETIENILEQLINWLLLDMRNNLLKKIFLMIAEHITTSNLYLYINKVIAWFHNIRFATAILTAIYSLWMIETAFFPGTIKVIAKQTRTLLTEYRNLFFRKCLNRHILFFFAASVFLGFTISVRVIGPLAGLLIALLAFWKFRWKSIPYIIAYGLVSLIVAYESWPFLWENPIQNFLNVFRHMADNPVSVNVLFNGTVYNSKQLPLLYLPILMLITLTEPALPLMVSGFCISLISFFKKKYSAVEELVIILLWFLIPFLYVLIFRPAMYDNYRHFLFLLPPVFFFAGIGIDAIFSRLSSIWIQIAMLSILLLPNLLAFIQYHPYEYTYYNAFVGGISGAENRYELDYWLLCYKDLTEIVNQSEKNWQSIYVALNPDLVQLYTDKSIIVKKMDNIRYPEDSLIFLPKRWDYQLLFPEFEIAYSIQRRNVPLCIAKVAP
ncbi:MAG: hypothetical protein HPY85_12790 [Anaerolineae bacterium]|nr:hypothetical protein [Anaerolineae bacterium]